MELRKVTLGDLSDISRHLEVLLNAQCPRCKKKTMVELRLKNLPITFTYYLFSFAVNFSLSLLYDTSCGFSRVYPKIE